MKKLTVLMTALALATGLMTGCGASPGASNTATPESTPAVTQESTPTPSESSTPEPEASVWPRTIIDAAGYEVVLEAQPQRIAILHSMYLEFFFSLGTPPVASAGANVGTAMKALEEFATLKPYAGTADILDLGSAREINLEAITAADPDVIVTFNGHGGINEIYNELIKIAPVVLLDYSVSWQEAIRDCAEIVGKEAVAEECIEETVAVMTQAREALAPLRDKTAIFVRSDGKGGIFAMGSARYPYYYDTETGFGLTKPEGYPEEWGVISLESLAEMNPDYIIFQDFLQDAQTLVNDLSASSVWNNLQAVKDDHVFYFDVSLNTTSPLALQVAAAELTNGLVK